MVSHFVAKLGGYVQALYVCNASLTAAYLFVSAVTGGPAQGGLSRVGVRPDEGEVARRDGSVDVALAVRAVAIVVAVVLVVKVGSGVLAAAAARRTEQDDHTRILKLIIV